MRKRKTLPVVIRIPARKQGTPAPDERTEQLLRIFSELEAQEATMSQDQFSDLLQQAALACGFSDAGEACESLLGPVLFKLQRMRCNGKDAARMTTRHLVTS